MAAATETAADWIGGLAVVLLHPVLLNSQRTVCRVLCVSKELQALIHRVCAGQLRVVFCSADPVLTRSFAAWLHRNHTLCAKQLVISLPWQHNEEAVDEEGFKQQSSAAAAAEAPQLRAAAAVLQQLPAHITSLELSSNDWQRQLQEQPSLVASLQARLQHLQHLTLKSTDNATCCSPFFPVLQDLPALTSLTVSRVIHSSKLRGVPSGLVSLDLGICSAGLQLAHLTRLTHLGSEGGFVGLEANDSLPPSLRHLQVGECHSVQRLVALRQLQLLHIGASYIPERRLLRLASCLTQLSELRLTHQSGWQAAAPAWGHLPLRHLELQGGAWASEPISAATLQHLAALTGLSHLTIQRLDRADSSPLQLAHMLQQLQQLRRLKLWATGAWPLQRQADSSSSSITGPAAAVAEENVVLTRAIAGLPLLQSLSLSLPELGQAAAAALGDSGPSLTSLKLRACGLQDVTLRGLARRLPGLRCLFLEYNTELSDQVLHDLFGSSSSSSSCADGSDAADAAAAVLVAAADGTDAAAAEHGGSGSSSGGSSGGCLLRQLTELDMRYCGVSDEGRRFLAALTQLQALQV